MEKLEIGQIVRSNSGRDKNMLFIVTGLSDNGYVYTKHLDDMKRVASIQIDEETTDPESQNATIRKELKRLGNEMEEVVYV